MTVIQSIFLGIVQGITEFLPISSSGHLVIVPYLLNWDIPSVEAFIFDVLVQVATLAAILAFFWKDFYIILRGIIQGLRSRHPFDPPPARLGWFILLASIPASVAGILLKSMIEKAFSNPLVTSISLFGTAVLLIFAEHMGKRLRNLDKITWFDSLIIGCFQVLALFPGISRSGATITGGMVRDFERPTAARFSFLMAVPVMLAAGSVAILDLLKIPNLITILPVYLPGFIASGITGYVVIGWLLSFLSRYSLYYFAAYCAIIGIITLIVIAV